MPYAPFLLACLIGVAHANISLWPLEQHPHNLALLDARDRAACLQSSVQGARCLPAAEFKSAQGELASFRDIYWALGAAGLNEQQPVLIFSDQAAEREALASILYLAGHEQVWLWPADTLSLARLLGEGAGAPRSLIREAYYTGQMRDQALILPAVVDQLLSQGWQPWHPQEQTQPVPGWLVINTDPLVGLSLFAQAILGGVDSMLVSIDPYPVATNRSFSKAQWLALSMVLLGLMLMVLLVFKRHQR